MRPASLMVGKRRLVERVALRPADVRVRGVHAGGEEADERQRARFGDRVGRPQPEPLAEIREDRGVLGQRAAVVEAKRGNAPLRVDLQVRLGLLLALAEIHPLGRRTSRRFPRGRCAPPSSRRRERRRVSARWSPPSVDGSRPGQETPGQGYARFSPIPRSARTGRGMTQSRQTVPTTRPSSTWVVHPNGLRTAAHSPVTSAPSGGAAARDAQIVALGPVPARLSAILRPRGAAVDPAQVGDRAESPPFVARGAALLLLRLLCDGIRLGALLGVRGTAGRGRKQEEDAAGRDSGSQSRGAARAVYRRPGHGASGRRFRCENALTASLARLSLVPLPLPRRAWQRLPESERPRKGEAIMLKSHLNQMAFRVSRKSPRWRRSQRRSGGIPSTPRRHNGSTRRGPRSPARERPARRPRGDLLALRPRREHGEGRRERAGGLRRHHRSLKMERFGGDFGQMLRWWRANKSSGISSSNGKRTRTRRSDPSAPPDHKADAVKRAGRRDAAKRHAEPVALPEEDVACEQQQAQQQEESGLEEEGAVH